MSPTLIEEPVHACKEAKSRDKFDGDVINSQVGDDETCGEDGKEGEELSGGREGTGVILEQEIV